jgi:hypothetical protein
MPRSSSVLRGRIDQGLQANKISPDSGTPVQVRQIYGVVGSSLSRTVVGGSREQPQPNSQARSNDADTEQPCKDFPQPELPYLGHTGNAERRMMATKKSPSRWKPRSILRAV